MNVWKPKEKGFGKMSGPVFACQPALKTETDKFFDTIYRGYVDFFLSVKFATSLLALLVRYEQKRLKTAKKKYFDQLLGVNSTQQLVEILNTRQAHDEFKVTMYSDYLNTNCSSFSNDGGF